MSKKKKKKPSRAIQSVTAYESLWPCYRSHAALLEVSQCNLFIKMTIQSTCYSYLCTERVKKKAREERRLWHTIAQTRCARLVVMIIFC